MTINNFHENLTFLSGKYYDPQKKTPLFPKATEFQGKLVCQLEGNEKEKVDSIIQFIKSHLHELDQSDKKSLIKINSSLNKLIKDINLKIKVKNEFKNFIEISDKSESLNKLPLTQKSNKSDTLFQIKASPQSRGFLEEKLQANLVLFLENYPRYQFGNNLALYDTALGDLPSETDIELVRKQILNYVSNFPLSNKTKSHCNEVLELIKHKEIVNLAIIVESTIGGDNIAMRNHVSNHVQNNIPVIMTKALLHCWPKEFETLLQDKDIYVQKNGSLLVILPKNEDPVQLGFPAQEENFQRWEGKISEIPYIPMHNIAEDLKSILADDTTTLGYHRLIFLAGHGSSGKIITNLPTKEFQNTLDVLQKKNMKFLLINSCYAGGKNSNDIHTSQGNIPCPILIESSLEMISYALLSPHFSSVLKEAQKYLFIKDKKIPLLERPLQQSDLKEMAKKIPSEGLHHIGTGFLPTNRQDIPKTAYTIVPPGTEVLDLTDQLKKMKSVKLSQTEILDTSLDRKAYLFSDPIVPLKLIFQSTVGSDPGPCFVSRGARNHHVIQEYCSEGQEFLQFVKRTYQPQDKNLEYPPLFEKVFAIGKMKCLFNSQPTELENVVIVSDNLNGFFQVIFKVKGEDKYTLLRGKNFTNSEKLSEKKALSMIYQYFSLAQPTEETLLQTSGGKTSIKDFYEALPLLFWGDNYPNSAKLIHDLIELPPNSPNKEELSQNLKKINFDPDTLTAILQIAIGVNNPIFSQMILDLIDETNILDMFENALGFEHEILLDLILKQKGNLLERKFRTEFSCTTDFIRKVKDLNSPILTKKILNLLEGFKLENILRHALTSNNEDIIEFITENIDKQRVNYHVIFNEQNEQGETPLHLWIKNQKITELLLKHGAKPSIENNKGISPFALAIDLKLNYPWVKKLISQNLSDDQAREKNAEKFLLAYASNQEVFKFIMDHGVKLNFKQNAINIAIFKYLNVKKIKDLINDFIKNGGDINEKDEFRRTILFSALISALITVDKNDIIRFLKELGADFRIVSKGEFSPLTLLISFHPSDSFVQELLDDLKVDVQDIKFSDDDTLLRLAASRSSEKIAEYLLNKGGNPVDQHFHPFLHLVIKNVGFSDRFKMKVIDEFIKKGGDLNLLDCGDKTPLFYARESNNQGLIDYLLANGANDNTA